MYICVYVYVCILGLPNILFKISFKKHKKITKRVSEYIFTPQKGIRWHSSLLRDFSLTLDINSVPSVVGLWETICPLSLSSSYLDFLLIQGLRCSSLGLLPVLCPHPAGERGHLGAHLTRLQTAHSHVLLPVTPGHRWHGLRLQHGAPDAGQPPEFSQAHLLCWLHHTDLSLLDICGHRMSSPGGDVLWSICSHLPPPPVFSHHELESLRHAGGDFLDHWSPSVFGSSSVSYALTLLHGPENRSFLLWNHGCSQTCLCRHTHQWAYGIGWSSFCASGTLLLSYNLVCVHLPCHP